MTHYTYYIDIIFLKQYKTLQAIKKDDIYIYDYYIRPRARPQGPMRPPKEEKTYT